MNNHARIFLPISMLIFGLMNIYLGKDLDWDLANYHYYNVFAFLHDRYDKDFWPASFNTYLNPTLDFLTYFLINTLPPKLTAFMQGAIHGIAIWILFNITLLFFPKNTGYFCLALITTGLAVYSPLFHYVFGTFMGDITIGIFVLGFFYLSCQAILHEKGTLNWGFCGFILGLGAGLKLTILFHVLGAAVALFFIIRFKYLFSWGIGVTIGFACTAGYWSIFLWKKFHNPVFPFYNTIFHSPFFPESSWHLTQFLPKTIWEKIFYPFFFSQHGSRVLDIDYVDWRFAILYVLLLLAGILYLTRIVKFSLNRIEKWILLFFIFSYVFWEISFSFIRYAIVLEMLTPLLIVLILKKITPNRWAFFLGTAYMFVLIVKVLATLPTERGPWSSSTYFGIEIPTHIKKIENGLVLLPSKNYYIKQFPLSLSYMIPFFQPANFRFVGVPFFQSIDFFSENIRDIISTHKGPLYILTSDIEYPHFIKNLSELNISPKDLCEEIPVARGRYREHQVLFCPAKLNYI